MGFVFIVSVWMMGGAGASLQPGAPQEPHAKQAAPALATSEAEPLTPYHLDTPPPTPYDVQVQQGPLGVAPETQSLLWYAGRVLMALLAVLALIYASAKVLLPRVFKKWSMRPGRDIEIVERLSLDGRNAVVLLRLASGDCLLVGTGEHGVQFLTRLEAGPAPDFHRTMAKIPNPLGETGESRHAAAH